MRPKIIAELENLLPELTDQEHNGLLDSIRKDRQTDPIKLGRIEGGDYFIIDGHNRYHICGEIEIEPKFGEVIREFENLEEAKDWIDKSQLGKRNLSDYHRGVVHLRVKDRLAKEAKERQLSSLKQNSTTVHSNLSGRSEKGDTMKKIAKESGISKENLRKIEKLSKEAPEEVRKDLSAGRTSIHKEYQKLKAKNKPPTKVDGIPDELLEKIRKFVGDAEPLFDNPTDKQLHGYETLFLVPDKESWLPDIACNLRRSESAHHIIVVDAKCCNTDVQHVLRDFVCCIISNEEKRKLGMDQGKVIGYLGDDWKKFRQEVGVHGVVVFGSSYVW